MRHLIVRSRNTSCQPLKDIEVPIPVVYRMGSVTPINKILKKKTRRNPYIEINSIEGCNISGNKILMKKRFNHARVRTAKWFTVSPGDWYGERFLYYQDKWESNIIVKRKNSSKGNGIYLLKSLDDYHDFYHSVGDDIVNYVFEKYYTYSREYRIHVSKFGCFYASRKMLINDAEDRWHRHSNNSVFINEDNPQFDKPDTWDKIVTDCQNALKAMHLDIAAFDVKVSKKGTHIILESNTAPSLKENGLNRYTEELNKIIEDKLWQLNLNS